MNTATATYNSTMVLFSIVSVIGYLANAIVNFINAIDTNVIKQIAMITLTAIAIYFAIIAIVTYVLPFILVCGKLAVLVSPFILLYIKK